ncbi:ArnT family glycosyltransferase [Bernardetia sp.]|uniref:ArnT family glycosyltransferase n=1 Tax=Bernardetia sp. TaxID=1937974 RepID=UPI0025C679A0|nr:hypothetical protein [Bernardetia sp.]
MFILIIGSVYFFTKTSYDYYTLIFSPYQQEYREAVTTLATKLLLENENPYRIENQPEYAQAYGIIQNFIAYPFAYFFGSTLITHRIVTFIGIVLSCMIIILWLVRLNIPLLVAFAATLTLYISFYYNVLPLNRPDSWGLFFMLTSIYVPVRYNYSSKSLFSSILLGLLAFYTKSYFILGVVSMGSFVFLFISKKKGLIYTSVFLVSFAISIYVVSHFYPLFFYLTVLSFLNYATEGSWAYVIKQILTFFYVNKFLFLSVLTSFSSLLFLAYKKKHFTNYKISFDFVSLEKGVFKMNISYENALIVYVFFVMFLIVSIFLGKNDGAFLTYYFTHTTPFLILFALMFLYKVGNKLIIPVGLLLIVSNLWSVQKLMYSPKLSEDEKKQWKIAEQYIKNSNHVIGSPVVANLIKENDNKVYFQGLSKQFMYISDVKSSSLKSIFPRYKEVEAVTKQFYVEIDSNITHQNFDLIVMEKGSSIVSDNRSIEKYYLKKDTINLAMPFTAQVYRLEFWKPKDKQ